MRNKRYVCDRYLGVLAAGHELRLPTALHE